MSHLVDLQTFRLQAHSHEHTRMPRFWRGGLFGLCAVEAELAAARDEDVHSIAGTEVVDENPEVGEQDPFDFNITHPPAPTLTVTASTCQCGFCLNSVTLTTDGKVPLPLIVQLRHSGRRVNVLLESADDMSIMRGGKKAAFKTVVVTRNGTRFDHLSSAAKRILNLKSVNGTHPLFASPRQPRVSFEPGRSHTQSTTYIVSGFKVAYVNMSDGVTTMQKLPRNYAPSALSPSLDALGVCTASS